MSIELPQKHEDKNYNSFVLGDHVTSKETSTKNLKKKTHINNTGKNEITSINKMRISVSEKFLDRRNFLEFEKFEINLKLI